MHINSGVLPPASLSTSGQPRHFGRETFNSLALANLLEPLRDERKHHMLDLGPACGTNVGFFSGFRCKIYVADLLDTLASKPAAVSGQGQRPANLFQRQLVIEDGVHLDIVLAWDLLNYLKANTLLELFGQLRQFCRQGTLLHALVWGHSEIPAEPMRFRIADDRHMSYQVSSPATRKGPRYAPREMERLMAGFHVSRSFLLRSGMQETLFTLDAADTGG